MGHDRKSRTVFVVILSALAIGTVAILLAKGTVAILDFILLGTRLLGNLPEVFWWASAVAVLVICGLGTLGKLGVVIWSRSKEPTVVSFPPGRLGVIYRSLSRVNTGEYAKKEVRELLGVLAVDFIALRVDSTDCEAAELFRKGVWTDDPALGSYFHMQGSSSEQGRRFLRFLRKPDSAPFLEETHKTLDRLISYGEFEENKELGNSHAND